MRLYLKSWTTSQPGAGEALIDTSAACAHDGSIVDFT
jgi:hypothetical protein